MPYPRNFVNYFLYPTDTVYDVPGTLTYAIVLVIAVYVIYKTLKILKIKIDYRLAIAVSPYVILGGVIRVLQDAGVLNSYWFVTPGIYFFIFFIVFLVLLVSIILERKRSIEYFKTTFLIGLLLATFALSFIQPVNLEGVVLTSVFYLPWVALFYIFKKWSLENRIVMTVQMFDATTTYVAVNYFGFYEKHVLPTLFINLFSPVSFIFLKLIGIVIILLLIDKFSDDKEFNNYLKLIIGILGGATGTRDFIALATLVG
jgi:uncharacterized membrane protein